MPSRSRDAMACPVHVAWELGARGPCQMLTSLKFSRTYLYIVTRPREPFLTSLPLSFVCF